MENNNQLLQKLINQVIDEHIRINPTWQVFKWSNDSLLDNVLADVGRLGTFDAQRFSDSFIKEKNELTGNNHMFMSFWSNKKYYNKEHYRPGSPFWFHTSGVVEEKSAKDVGDAIKSIRGHWGQGNYNKPLQDTIEQVENVYTPMKTHLATEKEKNAFSEEGFLRSPISGVHLSKWNGMLEGQTFMGFTSNEMQGEILTKLKHYVGELSSKAPDDLELIKNRKDLHSRDRIIAKTGISSRDVTFVDVAENLSLPDIHGLYRRATDKDIYDYLMAELSKRGLSLKDHEVDDVILDIYQNIQEMKESIIQKEQQIRERGLNMSLLGEQF